MSSNAVGLDRVSKVVGYKLTKGFFNESSPNLPQRIAVLAEANTNKQSGLSINARQILSAKEAGDLYGYGSPIYNIARILFPISGDGVGGIPVIVYPQAEVSGAAAKRFTITVTGTATGNATHTVICAGRKSLDGSPYDVNIATDDNATAVATKIKDAINAILGCPFSATSSAGVVTVTAKWKGASSQQLSLSMDNNAKGVGISYAVAKTVDGTGNPSLTSTFSQFGNNWNTIVLSSYDTSMGTTLQNIVDFNGRPDPESPTGRFAGTTFKPFICLTGTNAENGSNDTATDFFEDCTLAFCPAPLSSAMAMEAAANMCVLFARVAQDTPHLDVSGMYYPDMPTPSDGSIGEMGIYTNRDTFVKLGASTVDIEAGRYKVVDFVTTFAPTGENPPQYRYCRNLMLDFNIRFGYFLLEQANVLDHTIANDGDVVTADKVIKPKQWKQIVQDFAEDLAKRALVADPEFMKKSIIVNISTVNPDRLETFFRYKRTGLARISSTTAEAGFNFGKA